MNLKLHTQKAALAAALALLCAAPAVAVAPVQPVPVYREGEVLVRYRAEASGQQIDAVRGRLGLVAKRGLGTNRTELLALPAFTTTEAALGVLRGDPAVENAEPNFRRFMRVAIPNDPLFSQQWGLRNTGQANFSPTGPAGIPGADLNMAAAWDADGDGTADRTGDPSVIVAVIDDAVQTSHPDLAANIVTGRNFVACQDPANPNPTTSEGAHGTLVSGCIVAQGNNSMGVAGVTWRSSLMPLKFAFDTATFIDAMEYARDNGAKIINASFGGPGFSQMEQDLIASLAADDILFVTAAGNDDSNTDLAVLNYPANYDAENIVSVAATNRQDNIASFSQYGPLTVDVAAPGLQIVTTQITSTYSTGGVSGTSFASPYTAGVAALLKAHVLPQPDYLEMKARLIESGSAVSGANPALLTAGGRVDADLALDMAPRPALVVRGVSFEDGGNDVPDPGETLTVTFSVRNLWQAATGVTATLSADNGVTVDSGAQALGTIASQGQADATFQISIEPGFTDHRYVNFTLTLTADGGYTAVRTAGAELGTLTPGVQVTQNFTDNIYDEFHAWHVDIAPGAGSGKTLLIRTSTTGAQDVDLLVKKDVAPQYSITVGINPETDAGFFCTSGTTASCRDPDTLLSARLDGVEEVSVVNPAAGSYHAVVVNFIQSALPYTLEAVLVDGDVRPAQFEFVDISGAPPGMAVSNEVLITGITQPAPITVAGGEYSINGLGFTSASATISNQDRVRVRTINTSGARRTQLTVGGVTETFEVNLPPPPGFGSGDTACGGGGGGGRVPGPLLAAMLLGALARRWPRAA